METKGYKDIVRSRDKFRLEEDFHRLENPETVSRTLRYGTYPLIKKLIYHVMDTGIKGGEILDLGTPFGLSAFFLKQQMEKAQFFVVQDSPVYTKISREMFDEELMGTNVQWITGDYDKIPFKKSQKFKLIVSCLDFHRWRDPAKVMDLMLDRITARGKLLIADIRPEWGNLSKLIERTYPKGLLEAEAADYLEHVTDFANSVMKSCYNKGEMLTMITKVPRGRWRLSGSWFLNIIEGRPDRN